MIDCTFIKDGDRFKMLCKGHSGVCEAVSVLTQSLEGWCINNIDMIRDYAIEKHSGYMSIEYTAGREGEAVFFMTLIGLMLVEKQKPEEIRIFKDIS